MNHFKTFLCLTLLGLSFVAHSSTPKVHNSFICPQSTSLSGPTCCLEDKSLCQKIELKSSFQATFEQAAQVHSQYLNGDFPYGRVPNCHWNTLNYVEGGGVALFPQTEFSLWDSLEKNSTEISVEELTSGDVVIFEFKGQIKEDVLENNVPKWVWTPHLSLEHSAIVVGEGGVIFQKENFVSQVFSISGLEQARSAYERSFLEANGRARGKMSLRFFRLTTKQLSANLAP